MLPMEVVNRDHPLLRTICGEVPHRHDCRDLIEQMRTVMRRCGGIGLAANQLGCSRRVIVVRAGGFKQAIINPVITRSYGGKNTQREGCLSFGTDTALMVRDKQIVVEGFDENWKPVKFKLKKIAARCVQHEVDHLNGITIL